MSRPLCVLHVDDDPMNLRVVEEILTAFGHRAVKAHSGAEALEHLGRQVFDVVLMDIHMPRMSGIEVLQRLRDSVGPERNTPVIALTADVISRRPDEYRALGFDAFVSKPILVSGLLAAITKAAKFPVAPRRTRHAS
jgi:CheY-like chemotaxis protein